MTLNKSYIIISFGFVLFNIILLSIPTALKYDPERISGPYIIQGHYKNESIIINSFRVFDDDKINQHLCNTWNNYSDIYRIRVHLTNGCLESKTNNMFDYIFFELIIFAIFVLPLILLVNEYDWLSKLCLHAALIFFLTGICADVGLLVNSRSINDFSYSTSYNMTGSIYYGKYYNQTIRISNFDDQYEFLHDFCILQKNYPDIYYHNIYFDSCKIYDSYSPMKRLNIGLKTASMFMMIMSNVILHVYLKKQSYDQL